VPDAEPLVPGVAAPEPDVPPLAVVAPLDMPVLGDVLPVPLLPVPEADAPDWSVPLCLLQPARANVMTAVTKAMRKGA
jgi:hypothetical protein